MTWFNNSVKNQSPEVESQNSKASQAHQLVFFSQNQTVKVRICAVTCFRTYKLNWALSNTTLQSKIRISASESRETKFLIQMETFTLGSGLLAPLSDKEGAQCFTMTDTYTKATGLIIRDQGQVDVS